MNISVVLLCAGKGTRYHGKKQNIIFHEKPLWKYAYDTACSVIDRSNVIVVGKDISGGNTRSQSVLNGLENLPSNTRKVLIVEAARPMVTTEQLQQLIESPFPSVSFVRSLVNTVIYRDGTYIDRSQLYELLTPQAFDYQLLLTAYHQGKFNDMTDETRVMFEFHGIKPHFIETGNNLFKVTYPGDLDIIESIYKDQYGGRHS